MNSQTVTVAGGTCALNADGSVTFTPATGFHGKAAVSYTVRDDLGTVSNTATLTVTVKPDPTAAIVIASSVSIRSSPPIQRLENQSKRLCHPPDGS